MKSPVTITASAKEHLIKLIKGKNRKGIKIGVETKGCSGMAYTMTYADEKDPLDETVQLDDVFLFIDPKAMMFIIGIEIDYATNELESGFIFNNPNEKGRCGCGKSFHV